MYFATLPGGVWGNRRRGVAAAASCLTAMLGAGRIRLVSNRGGAISPLRNSIRAAFPAGKRVYVAAAKAR